MTLTVVMALGCGPQALERQIQPIVGGMTAPGETAVVLLSTGCAGVLIAPRTVVSAAPCLNLAAGMTATVSTAARVSDVSPGNTVDVEMTWVHPLWRSEGRPSLSVALLRDAPAATPYRWNERVSLAGLEGAAVRLVSFGATGLNDASPRERRSVGTRITTLTTTGLSAGNALTGACNSDIGGPMLMRFDGGPETVVGVLAGLSGTCGNAVGDRLDLQATVLLDLLESHELASCARERKCVPGCTPPDIDCLCVADGQCNPECPGLDDPDCGDCARNGRCSDSACPRPDVDCVPLGSRCMRDEMCASRRCINDVQNADRYCSASCSTQAECGAGLECLGGACTKRQLPAVPVGAACTPGQSWCLDDTLCTGVDGGPTFCARTCTSATACLIGQRCENATERDRRICVQANRMPDTQTPEPTLPAAPRGCSVVFGAWPLCMLCLRRANRRREAG